MAYTTQYQPLKEEQYSACAMSVPMADFSNVSTLSANFGYAPSNLSLQSQDESVFRMYSQHSIQSDLQFSLPQSNFNQNDMYTVNNFPVTIEYKKFPDKLFKVQKRAKGKSQQRIESGELQVLLDFRDEVTTHLVNSIQVRVKRTNEVKNTPQYVGPVPLEPRFDLQHTKYLISVNLDSVYEVNGKKVYSLQKTLTDELNTFHLIFDVTLQDGRKRTVKTKEVLLVGKKILNEKGPANGTKKRHESISSNDSLEPLCKAPSLSSGYSSPQSSPREDEEVLRAKKIVTNHIKTKSMEVGGILVNNIIETPHGDIAYHFPLSDCRDSFQEGEIVGLVNDEVKNKLNIVKLTAKKSAEVALKGVITRSQYFEAQKPRDNTPTETICMMGVVPVKVKGSVEPNEPIYASPDIPGVATSGFHLTYNQMKEAPLVGYAFQSHTVESEEKIGLVKAGVSVLSSASQVLLNRRIRDMEKHWNEKIANLKRSNRNFKRFFLSCSVITIIICLLTGIFLWQLLAPGSAYRYYVCRRGSLSGHTSTFKYSPGPHNFNYPTVNGIEFKFSTLMKKLGHNYQRMNTTGARYYLNIDRCAYGGVRSTRDEATGQKRVYGPDIFAVDHKCFYAYAYSGVRHKWMKYDSVSWPNHKNIHCKPETV